MMAANIQQHLSGTNSPDETNGSSSPSSNSNNLSFPPFNFLAGLQQLSVGPSFPVSPMPPISPSLIAALFAAASNVSRAQEPSVIIQQQQQQQRQQQLTNEGAALLSPNGADSECDAVADSKQSKRRNRVGGPSVKTAEVWRFFTQCPPQEQAAICNICKKQIKATNSSTTGMIRHLKSCHMDAHVVLTHARTSNNIMKALKTVACSDDVREEVFEYLQSLLLDAGAQKPNEGSNSPSGPPRHTVESIIGEVTPSARWPEGTTHHSVIRQAMEVLKKMPQCIPLFGNSSNASSPIKQPLHVGEMAATQHPSLKRPIKEELDEELGEKNGDADTSSHESAKRIKLEEQEAIAPSTPSSHPQVKKRRKAVRIEPLTDLSYQLQENQRKCWPDDWREAKRLTDQIASMLVTDNDMEAQLVERRGFRHFLKAIVPMYRMPSAMEFRTEIIPRIVRQLHADLKLSEALQLNNPFGTPISDSQTQCNISSISSRPSSPTVLGVSPATTIESGFQEQDEFNGTATSLIDQVALTHPFSTPPKSKKIGDIEAAIVKASVHAQSISQSFSHSLDVSRKDSLNTDTSSSVCSSCDVLEKTEEITE